MFTVWCAIDSIDRNEQLAGNVETLWEECVVGGDDFQKDEDAVIFHVNQF